MVTRVFQNETFRTTGNVLRGTARARTNAHYTFFIPRRDTPPPPVPSEQLMCRLSVRDTTRYSTNTRRLPRGRHFSIFLGRGKHFRCRAPTSKTFREPPSSTHLSTVYDFTYRQTRGTRVTALPECQVTRLRGTDKMVSVEYRLKNR